MSCYVKTALNSINETTTAATMLANALGAKPLASDDPLLLSIQYQFTAVAQWSTQRIKELAATAGVLFSNIDPCIVIEESRVHLQTLRQNSLAWSRATGLADPLQGFTAPISETSSWSIWTIGKWALIAAGVYYGYKAIKAPLQDLFGGSSEYPRAKLPRYAGGRRR